MPPRIKLNDPLPKLPQRAIMVMDSGAFSAWNQGAEIELGEYMDFLFAHGENFTHAINLDVIPATKGRVPTRNEAEYGAWASWRNLMIMRRAGLDVMPVFHLGERYYWLEKMIGEGFDYIGLGGTARIKAAVGKDWLDGIFSRVCGNHPYPAIRLHGLGVTNFDSLHRYPWFSVDSASYAMSAGFGGLVMPQMLEDGHSPDWTKPPYMVHISYGGPKGRGRSSTLKSSRAFDSLGKHRQKMVMDYIRSHGFDLEQVRTSHQARCILNSWAYWEYEKNYQHRPFPKLPRIGAGKGIAGSDSPPDDFHLYFVLCLSQQYTDGINVWGCPKRLFSYWYFKKEPRLDFEMIMERGGFKKPSFKSDTWDYWDSRKNPTR
jgi:hypothetical protein